MRKAILTLISAVFLGFAQGQVIQCIGGNEHTYVLDQALNTDCKLAFKNITGKSTVFAYKKVSSDFPMKWQVSFCDNRSCFFELIEEDSFAVIAKDAIDEFKITVSPQGHADTAKVVYAVYDRENNSVQDTVIFNFMVHWGAGIKESGSKLAKIYPNPVLDQIRVENITSNAVVRIFSQAGKELSEHTIDAANPVINVQHLPSGLYYISGMDGNFVFRNSFIKQ